MNTDDFQVEGLDDDKTIEFIKGYLPQEVKEKFNDDDLYYILDLIDEYYIESGILDQATDAQGYVEVDLEEIVKFIIKESKKDKVGAYEADDILFVVQGEMEYGDSLEE